MVYDLECGLTLFEVIPLNSQSNLVLRLHEILFNTSYLTGSDIFFTLKLESVSKITTFGLQMTVESGLEKIFLKFLLAGTYFPLLHKSGQNPKFSNKNNHVPAWRDFKINLSRPLFTVIFRPKMIFLLRFHFEGKNDGCLTALQHVN